LLAFDLLRDLKERMLAPDEENRDLKTQLAKKALITGPVPPFGYLYEKTEEAQQHPLCPRVRVLRANPSIDGPSATRETCLGDANAMLW
jgi:hypothetical protein